MRELVLPCCMQAIRRGTGLAVQLQVLFVCVVLLLTLQAQHYLTGLPQSARTNTLTAAVPYLATLVVAVALLSHPWDLPGKQEAARGVRSGSNQQEQEAPEETPEGDEDRGKGQEDSAKLGPDEGPEGEKPTEQVGLLLCLQLHMAPRIGPRNNDLQDHSMFAPLLWCRTDSMATEVANTVRQKQ